MSKFVLSLALGLASLAGISSTIGSSTANAAVANEAKFAAVNPDKRYIYRTEAEALVAKQRLIEAGRIVLGPFPVQGGYELLVSE